MNETKIEFQFAKFPNLDALKLGQRQTSLSTRTVTIVLQNNELFN